MPQTGSMAVAGFPGDGAADWSDMIVDFPVAASYTIPL